MAMSKAQFPAASGTRRRKPRRRNMRRAESNRRCRFACEHTLRRTPSPTSRFCINPPTPLTAPPEIVTNRQQAFYSTHTLLHLSAPFPHRQVLLSSSTHLERETRIRRRPFTVRSQSGSLRHRSAHSCAPLAPAALNPTHPHPALPHMTRPSSSAKPRPYFDPYF
jgi:hypothetical protein